MDSAREQVPRAPRIALTLGEPAGIGPDLVAMLAAAGDLGDTVIVGDPEVLSQRAHQLGLTLPPLHCLTDAAGDDAAGSLSVLPVTAAKPVTPGLLEPANAASVVTMLERAVDGTRAGAFDALVTAPVHKAAINRSGVVFSGHTEFLAERTSAAMPVMMLAAGGLRVALATTHLPLRQVPDALTAERLEAVLRVLVTDLRNRFAIPEPQVLVAGLNPHAGEDGHLGDEEQTTITPVLEHLRSNGMDLRGPMPADTLFTPDNLAGADAVLAMYHDQGLPVLKHAGFGRAVNITLGLPIIRTSVDHGTALDLAGTGAARDGSLRAALDIARDLVRRARNSAPERGHGAEL
ncbi:MAG: 4-hydroxythreonine-4-phosphate dehydrogenase PdxA [Ectothiorhodospiraceae bacterium]